MRSLGGLLAGLGSVGALYGWAGELAKRRLNPERLTGLTPKQADQLALAGRFRWPGTAIFVVGLIVVIATRV